MWAGFLEHNVPYVEYRVDLGSSTSSRLRHLDLSRDRQDGLTVGVVEIDSEIAGLTVFTEIGSELNDQVHRRMSSGKLRGAYFIEYAQYIEFFVGCYIGTVGREEQDKSHRTPVDIGSDCWIIRLLAGTTIAAAERLRAERYSIFVILYSCRGRARSSK